MTVLAFLAGFFLGAIGAAVLIDRSARRRQIDDHTPYLSHIRRDWP